MNIFKIYVKSNRIKFVVIICLLILLSIVTLPLPYFSKLIIDDVLINQQFSKAKFIFLGFSFILVIQIILGRALAIDSAKFSLKLNEDLKLKVFNSNLRLQKDMNQVSHIQTVLLNDVDLLCNNFMQIILTFFSNITSLIGYLVVIIIISPQLTIFAIAFIPIYVLWLVFVSEKLKILNHESQKTKEELLKESNDVFSSYLVIKIYNLTNFAKNNFGDRVAKNVNVTKKIYIYNNFINIISKIIVTSAAFLPLFVGINLVKNGSITIGELIAFNSYCGIMFAPITSIVQLMTVIKTTEVYEQRIKNALSVLSKEKAIYIEKKSDNPTLKIVDVTINNETEVLIKNINLNLHCGEVIQLVGQNGSGKSLLLKSVIQYYQNYSGEFYFDGTLLNQGDISEISRQIVYISNDQGIYMENLKKNLNSNKPELPDIQIWEILELVGLSDKIHQLPEELETSKFEVETNFSTGEIQKLRIARALLKNPKVLMVDEILSNIDKGQVIWILKKIKLRFPKISIIVIEHHLCFDELVDWKWEISQKSVNITKMEKLFL